MVQFKSRGGRAGVALAAVLLLAANVADARPGGGGSAGSRGSRTFDQAPATKTAPNAAAPMQRTQAPQPAPNAQQAGAPAQAQGGRFGGFAGGLMAGVLGAGLIGALMGGGFGGLSGILSMLMQVLLIGGLIWLGLRLFRRRQSPALAGAGASERSALGGGSVPPAGGGLGSGLGAGLGGLGAGLGGLGRSGPAPRAANVRQDEVGIGPDEYAAFERTLVGVQEAYSREDVATLWTLATPEMAGYFQEELNDNARRGVVNKVSDVQLLQGDLAEAWREGGADYATVAMRYRLTDVTTEKSSGRIVAGEASPTEAVELWTFRRDAGGPWKVSAIQQTT